MVGCAQQLAVAIMALAIAACGSVAGNPRRPGDTPPVTTDVIDVQIPKIEFDIDASITDQPIVELAHALAPATGEGSVVKWWGARSQLVLKQTTNLLEKLIEEKVTQTGTFRGKGPFKKMTGEVAVRSGDATYGFEAIICESTRMALHVKWNEGATKVAMTRDFNIRPLDKKGERDVVAQIAFEKTEGSQKTTFLLQGEAWDKPAGADGSLLTEYTETERTSTSFTIKGVNDYSAAIPAAGVYEGDGYLVARLTADTKEFVAYRKSNRRLKRCEGAFDETASSNPGWCTGGIVTKDDPEFTADELSVAFTRLKGLGLVKKENLKKPAFDTGLKCPAD